MIYEESIHVDGWPNVQSLQPVVKYQCGYCGERVAAVLGWRATNGTLGICPNCLFPTFIGHWIKAGAPLQVPTLPPGRPVAHLSGDLKTLYEEARQCIGVRAYTGAVLLFRRMLVDMACSQGDTWEKGKPFIKYVEFLTRKIFAPDYSATWLDRIRERGNTATHELGVMSDKDANLLLDFVEMLLKVMFEYPNAVPPASQP